MSDIQAMLNAMASDTIGDGGSPNVYFVTDGPDVVTVTLCFATAHAHWSALASRRPLRECALEDRQYGVIACVEPVDDSDGARLTVYDDSTTTRFGREFGKELT